MPSLPDPNATTDELHEELRILRERYDALETAKAALDAAHPITYSVGAAIVREGKVLVLAHQTNGVVIPGGEVRAGETAEETLARVVFADVALKVTKVRELLGVDRGPGYRCRVYRVEVEPGEPKVGDALAVQAVWWGAPHEVALGRFSQDRPFLEVALRLAALEAEKAQLEALIALGNEAMARAPDVIGQIALEQREYAYTLATIAARTIDELEKMTATHTAAGWQNLRMPPGSPSGWTEFSPRLRAFYEYLWNLGREEGKREGRREGYRAASKDFYDGREMATPDETHDAPR